MGKRTPHTRLAVLHALVDAGRVRATRTALERAAMKGLDFKCGDVLIDFFKELQG